MQLYSIYPTILHQSYSTPLSNFSNSTPLIPFYPTYHATISHISHSTLIVPLYPTHPALSHPSYSTSSIPIYPIQYRNANKNYKREQKIQTRTKIRTPSVTTSTRYTNCSGDGDGGIRQSRSTPLIPFNNARPAIPKPSNFIPSNIKGETNHKRE